MTVSTEVSREEYTGNGVTTDFDYRFRVFQAADLVVSVADTTENITVLTLNTDYTVTGAGSRTGGKVKLFSPLAFNWRINIERALPVTQETDIRNQGNFFPEVHEDAFDKLTMLIQQVWSYFGLALRKPTWLAKFYDAQGNRIANLGNPINPQDAATKSYVDTSVAESDDYADDLFKRTLRVPETFVGQLPAINIRKNKILAFNAAGNPIPILPESGSASDVILELANGLMGVVPASLFGLTGIGNESEVGKQFLDFCSENNLQALFDIDVNLDGMVWSGDNINITGQGKINGWVYIRGQYIASQTDPVAIGTPGNWSLFPIGTTTFSGNFSAYAPGDNIMLSLNGTGDAGSTESGELNQIGVHFSTVVSASSTSLVIANPTRFKFDTIRFTRFVGKQHMGSVPAGTFVLSGNYSFLSSGQMIRIENIDSSGGFQNSKFYFEYTRVKSASATELVLTDATFHSYGNPWIVSAKFCKNINIANANFATLQSVAIDGGTITNVRADRLVNDYLYDAIASDLRLRGNTPNIVNWTFVRNMAISNVVAEGATGDTDNAACKFMSPINVNFNGLSSADFGRSAGVQSINGFFVDALFTPYRCWGNINVSGIKSSKSRGGLGFWFVGVDGLPLDNISASSISRIYQCKNVTGNITCSDGFFSSDNENITLDMDVKFGQSTGDKHATFSGLVRSPAGANANRCWVVAGSARNTISEDICLDGLRCLSTNAADTFLHVQNVKDFIATGCRDFSGLANSLTLGGNLDGEITVDNHRLRNAIANEGTRSGSISHEAMLKIGSGGENTSAWDRNHLVMGETHIYPEAGRLKMNVGTPTGAGQGYYLSRRVTVPISPTAGGQTGDWAADATYFYWVYSANTWARVARDNTWGGV
ncbi:hypothetical protein [Serratia fonticola]|uniref:hypothetical protein n=1 Tax=Serratia fonticola TaxID=47917 RepID=UPI00217C4EDF|nr:hypothetical protein [Serratia fonticola]CAI1034397.1 Uncharacterised protein [Serratia fonticola]